MTIELGNWLYILVLLSLIFLVVIMAYASVKLPQRIVYWIIVFMLFSNFALHFLKQLLPSYISDFPYSLSTSTFENICAVSVLLFPFIFLFGGKYTKDYMFYIGILSALGAYIFAGSIFGRRLDNLNDILETIRYYACHAPLIIAPIMMVFSGLHKLDYRRILIQPFIFFAVLLIVLLNELFLVSSGLVQCSSVDFFSRDYRNGAFIFGPPSEYDNILSGVYFLIPPFFTYIYPGTDLTFYVPILWLTFPIIIFGPILCFLMCLPFENRHIKIDLYCIIQQHKLRRASR